MRGPAPCRQENNARQLVLNSTEGFIAVISLAEGSDDMDAVLLDVIAKSIRSVAKRTQTMAITENSLLVEDLALDSLDLVGVLMKMEDHFHLKIDLDTVGEIQSVAELGAHIETLRRDHASAA